VVHLDDNSVTLRPERKADKSWGHEQYSKERRSTNRVKLANELKQHDVGCIQKWGLSLKGVSNKCS
jgi:hypothetical protein